MSTSVQVVHGREMHDPSIAYTLPVDDQEQTRLGLQHRMWILHCGGLTPLPTKELDALLTPKNDDHQPTVLDLGCGSGIWCLHMARAYKQAKVVGIDAVATNPRDPPPNCTFVQRDLRDDLSSFYGSADLVQMRLVLMHLPEEQRRTLILEAIKCLRPGGVILALDVDITKFDISKNPILPAYEENPNPTHSWISRFFEEGNKVLWHLSYLCTTAFPGWFAESGVVDKETIKVQDYYTPIGWPDESQPYGEELGQIMGTNVMELIHGFTPALLASGIPQETLSTWVSNIEAELDGPQLKSYFHWQAVWGYRT